MLEDHKIEMFFNSYLGSPKDMGASQPLIRALQHRFLNGEITASDIVKILVQQLDSTKKDLLSLIERGGPPPIIIELSKEQFKQSGLSTTRLDK
jgi:hypothetical protein